MADSRLIRRDFIKVIVGGLVFLLQPMKGIMAAEPSSDVPLYGGEPSIGEPGYEERMARVFEQATPRKGR